MATGDACVLALAIVTVLVTNTNPTVAEVRHVQSSLTATGREHACPDEPLIFNCQVNGQYIQWTFNTFYRATFFYDHTVNSVQTVSGQYGVRVILTANDAIPTSPTTAFRHFKSSLIIESSNSLVGYLHNVSCSSDTETHTRQIKIAEIPNMPLNIRIQVNRVQLSAPPAPYTLSVRWDAPDNSEKFDLEHFQVYASMLLSEQGNRYVVNGTSFGLEYQFHSDIIPPKSNINVTVTAVSKCSQQLRSSAVVNWKELKAMFTNVPVTDSNAVTSVINGYKELTASIHKVFVLAFDVIVSMYMLFSV